MTLPKINKKSIVFGTMLSVYHVYRNGYDENKKSCLQVSPHSSRKVKMQRRWGRKTSTPFSPGLSTTRFLLSLYVSVVTEVLGGLILDSRCGDKRT